jgi:hypothetical protein
MYLYREKKIYSGPIMDIEIYPVNLQIKNPGNRRKKEKVSSEFQKKLNEKNAKKRVVRLVNGNFTRGDLIAHLTFRPKDMPSTYEEVKKHVTNYIRRIKVYRKKHGLPDMKYIYVIEYTVKKTGELNWHVHLIMSAMDRNVAEDMWPYADWTNVDRLQPNEFGSKGIARYMAKDPQGKKRWSQSRNLEKPYSPKPKDGKHTKLGVKRMATMYVDDATYFEKKYKGYQFLMCEPLFNEYNMSWYMTITMRVKE